MIQRKPIRVIYISTYIPQKCGIATFTKDVTNAINMLNPYALAEIMPIVKENEDPEFPWEVKCKIQQNDLNSYFMAADYINHSSCEVVLIEHEFGIFGGHCGEYVVPFLEHITKPKVMTCHTIINDPENEWGQVFIRTIKHVNALTVMSQESAKRLVKLYGVEKNKITVIPHGTPDLAYAPTESYKKKRKLTGKLVLGNINLLSVNKGIDYSIEAVAEIVKVFPKVIYLIIGQTHPNIIQYEGEKYRTSLKKKVADLGIEKNIRFVNHYVTLDELVEWLRVIDIYITPYLDPQQSSSGALSYAVGAGKSCISTEYFHAKEMLGNGRGVLVPFRDSQAIASAVIDLWSHEAKRKEMERAAYEYGRHMTWTCVGLQHLDLFAEVIKNQQKRKISHQVEYLLSITDNTGVIEHSKFDEPDYAEGYCVDDNARALQVSIRLGGDIVNLRNAMECYFNFIKKAQKEKGCHNDLNQDLTWKEDNDVHCEYYGRAISAMGEMIKFGGKFAPEAKQIFEHLYSNADEFKHVRVYSQIIFGLNYQENTKEIKKWADLMVETYKNEKTDDWMWFEESLSYDNGRLPMALLTAYAATKNKVYLDVAIESLDFLTKKILDPAKDCFVYPGNKGWIDKFGKRAIFDQQPIEAGSMTEAYCLAFSVTKDSKYIELAIKAFDWYHGKNSLGLSMINPVTGGIYDGLMAEGVNLNQGAESVLSYLLGWAALRKEGVKNRH